MLRRHVLDDVIQKANDKAEAISFFSRFKFLRAVNGLRPGCLNGIIGTTGSGKSTLFKSIIADTAQDAKCLVWLSEESIEEYQPKINLVVKDKAHLDNILFLEEKSVGDWYFSQQKIFFSFFREMVRESECKVLFIDNITSSYLYSDDVNVREQGKSAVFLNRLAKEFNIAICFIAHTRKTVNDTYTGMITKEDVRGSQKISIVSEYLWVIQKFQQDASHYPIMQLCKHRFHEVEDKYFLLFYQGGNYLFDKKIDFELVKEIFKGRDRL